MIDLIKKTIVYKLYVYLANIAMGYWYYLNRNNMVMVWQKRCSNKWIKRYKDGIGLKHRSYLIEQFSSFEPISNILVLGCGPGANMRLLTEKYKEATLVGVDINKPAIEYGVEWFKEHNYQNVKLYTAALEDFLPALPNKSFDILLTDAVLMYINRVDIRTVMEQAIRVTRKGIISFELGTTDDEPLGVFRRYWLRNYDSLFKTLIPEIKVSMTKIPPEVWPSPRWIQDGYLTVVKL